jgi:hypothetical protein
MPIENGVTLFTSDSRPRYAVDLLNVLALPLGTEYHFRYSTSYVPSQIRHEFENCNAPGTVALIAFRDESQQAEAPFMVPVRWATITSVQLVADFYVVGFELGNYPILSDHYNGNRAEIEEKSSAQREEFVAATRDLPVQAGLTSLVEPTTNFDRNTWIQIAKTLALHERFSSTHFLRVRGVTDRMGRDAWHSSERAYVLSERQYGRIRLDYFAEEYEEDDAVLCFTGDESLIRIASRANIPLDSRYDSRQVLIQAGSVPGHTSTEVEISVCATHENPYQTTLRLPFQVSRSKGVIIARIATSAAGAGMVAAPGILGDTLQPVSAVLVVCVGALVLAIGTNLVGSSR